MALTVDRISPARAGETVEHSARLRWDAGEATLRITLPEELAAPEPDASPFLAATLLQAMRRHADLHIDGSVSERLLWRSDTIQAALHAWDPSLRRCAVSVAATHRATERGRGRLCFFSRGVDSTYSAAVTRHEPGPLTGLVFVRGFEPARDEQEVARAREAAAALGLELHVCETNLREISEPLMSWGDQHGAGLASVALALAGGARHVVHPATASFATVAPHGSHPLVDHLYSTEAVQIEHDDISHGRLGKVAWLARERPELVDLLRVCYFAEGADNCGECGKCLFTMACLEAAGALRGAAGFPDRVEPGALAQMRLSTLPDRIEWSAVARALPPGDLREAVLTSLRRSARIPLGERIRARLSRRRLPDPVWSGSANQFNQHHTNTAVSLLRDGRPYP